MRMIKTGLISLLLAPLAACGPSEHVQTATTVRDASAPAPSRTDMAARLLAAHNGARADAGVPNLIWSEDLARAALPWAQTLARDGRLRHSDQATRPGQGENLWVGTAEFFSYEHMMGAFLDEKKDFRPGIFPEVSRTGKWQDVAHYTQIIWPETREVGCSLATANGRDALVCRYSPAGNFIGQPVG